MPAIHETAYPRVKPYFSEKELDEVFTLSDIEIQWLDQKTKLNNSASRLGLSLLLKCYQYLGRIVRTTEITPLVKEHLCKQLAIEEDVDLKGYHRATRRRHVNIIREYLKIKIDNVARRDVMKKAALSTAQTKEDLCDIINRIIEELIRERYELPGFSALTRLARAARTLTNREHYKAIVEQLSDKQKQFIDGLLSATENAEAIDWSWSELKTEPKKPTPNNIKIFTAYVQKLQILREKFNLNLDFILPARLEHLYNEAMVNDCDDMRKVSDNKRYGLVAILIYMRLAYATDESTMILMRWIRNIESTAKTSFEKYQLAQAEKNEQYVLLLYNMLLTVDTKKSAAKKIREIEQHLEGNIKQLLEGCKAYLGLTGDKHLSWTLSPYKNKRNILLNLVSSLTIFSSSADKSVENGLKFIQHHRSSTKTWIEVKESNLIQPDVSLLSAAWLKLAAGTKKREPIRQIHKHYYEMAVLNVLSNDLSCNDAYVENAFEFDDPNKQFIPWDKFYAEIGSYCKLIDLPTQGELFATKLNAELCNSAQMTNDAYLNNPSLIIHNRLPVLKKLPTIAPHPEQNKIRQIIMDEMPIVSIVKAIVDVEKWTHISSGFKPLSGNESKIKDYPYRFASTILSYGALLGPTQTSRSLPQFSRKQIARPFNRHTTEQRLVNAINRLNKRYKQFDLPYRWGKGDSASVDGTFWDMYTQNLLAAHHIRYGRYGGVGYYHVSDQYIALFSNFISCAVHESIFLLDGIVENDNDVKRIYGDSWAQSEVLFALSYLMGIAIMPRIKHLKHLKFYKANPHDHYEHIQEIFTDSNIDWDLIKTHFHDMLRVVMSIQSGKIKPSTILRKLCSKSRKNKLYFAFRELGRVRRTIFLLNYINDPQMRREIHAATCKSEEFNEFIDWVAFGGGGVIADNLRFSQKKIIKFNHLLANILMFHNVVNQTKVINNLRSRGIDVPDEVLQGISPLWRENYNRFGTFMLDMNDAVEEVDYHLK